MQIILASHNAGKIAELKHLLNGFNVDLIPEALLNIPPIEETGTSFVENALLKARHAAKKAKQPAIADDSGLIVPYLKGAPGIYSARYAGLKASAEDNIKKLLDALKNVPDQQRFAYFYCVIVFLADENDPIPLICEGIWKGSILHEASTRGGFGYDPIFYDAPLQKAASELSIDQKNKISHRGLALQSLIKRLPSKLRQDDFLSWE